MSKHKKIYLAIPYTNEPDKDAIHKRANIESGILMMSNNIVFSPISMGHAIAKDFHAVPTDWVYWRKVCISFLEWCDELHVVKTPNLESSTGVMAEIRIVEQMGKPVIYI